MADRNTSAGALFSGGILSENPILRLGLGLCPALAVTTTAVNGLALGVATGCVLVCTSLIVSILGKAVTEKGLVGAFTGGIGASAGGICAAVFFALLAALLFRSREKK